MFLVDGSLWQVGLASEEGAGTDDAEASDLSASPLPTQRRWERRLPVPIHPAGLWVPFPTKGSQHGF